MLKKNSHKNKGYSYKLSPFALEVIEIVRGSILTPEEM